MDKLLPTDASQQCAALAVHPWQRSALEGPVAYHPGHDGQLPYGRSGKTMCGQTLSSFPQYRRIKDLKLRPNSFCVAFNEGGTSKVCVCADCWRQAHIADSWHVQVRAMIHVCGPSCWKYNSNGIRICRHHCYHIAILEPDPSAASPAEKPLKL